MKNLLEILTSDSQQLLTCAPNSSVYDAIKLMSENGIGALLVIDEQRKLAGIISERDYMRKVILHGKSSKETLVSEIMTDKLITASPSATAFEAMSLMNENNIRHLPVVGDDEDLKGIVSIRDLMKVVIDAQEFIIGQLESYMRQ